MRLCVAGTKKFRRRGRKRPRRFNLFVPRAYKALMTTSPPRLREHADSDVTPGAIPPREAWRTPLTEGLDALYRFIYFRVGMDEHTAEDILQQTACAALQYDCAPECDEEKQWLLRGIAMNLVRRHWRTTRRRTDSRLRADPRLALALLSRLESRDVGAPGADVSLREEQRHQLLLAVSSLGADEQWMLYAFYKHNRSRADIAKELGVSSKSVETRLYRIRNRLRDMLLDMTKTE